jgi:hypothetical protein
MTLDGIAKRLDAIDAKLGGLEAEMKSGFRRTDAQLHTVKTRADSIESEMRSGFTRVGEELNNAKIRDEELHGLLKFSLEAREGLRESIEERFDGMGKKQDQELDLLKDVLRHVAGTRASG